MSLSESKAARVGRGVFIKPACRGLTAASCSYPRRSLVYLNSVPFRDQMYAVPVIEPIEPTMVYERDRGVMDAATLAQFHDRIVFTNRMLRVKIDNLQQQQQQPCRHHRHQSTAHTQAQAQAQVQAQAQAQTQTQDTSAPSCSQSQSHSHSHGSKCVTKKRARRHRPEPAYDAPDRERERQREAEGNTVPTAATQAGVEGEVKLD